MSTPIPQSKFPARPTPSSSPSPSAQPLSTPKWAHPGTFMSPVMTRTLKADVAKSAARQKALAKLIKETPLTYKPQALEVVDINYGGAGVGHKECTRDGEMAVSAALVYWANGDQSYAKLALDILEAWPAKNKVWKGQNALLEASWSICSMARAAELLKYAPDKLVTDRWRRAEPAFIRWIDTVIMPVLKSEHIWGWKPIGNWHFSQICARMQLAILREDTKEWEWCSTKYPYALNETFKGSAYELGKKTKCPGEISESCRDVTHCAFQLGGIAQAAEIALHQGVDLYDNRLVDAFELQARIMMREIPPGFTAADIKTPYGYWPEPVWHIAYAHFNGRKHIPMPKTKAYLDQIGIDRVTFHWGPNCLTHYLRL